MILQLIAIFIAIPILMIIGIYISKLYTNPITPPDVNHKSMQEEQPEPSNIKASPAPTKPRHIVGSGYLRPKVTSQIVLPPPTPYKPRTEEQKKQDKRAQIHILATENLDIPWHEKADKVLFRKESGGVDRRFMELIQPNDEFAISSPTQPQTTLDPLFPQVARSVVQYGKAYLWYIQREFNVSYDRGLLLMYQLDINGVAHSYNGEVWIKSIPELNIKLRELNMPEVKPETAEERDARRKKMIEDKIKDQNERQAFEKKVKKDLENEGVIEKQPRREYIPRRIIAAVYKRDKGCCVYCGSTHNLQIDHIIPVSKGGATTLKNLQLLCQTCNLKKSNKID